MHARPALSPTQVLANMRAMESDKFLRDKVGIRDPGVKPLGPIPDEKLNAWGGSLSIGHPFGATGTRILTTTANRLIAGKGRYGVLAACAAGGQAHAMLVERYVK